MGKLIGSGNTENFGEKLFIDKVQEYLNYISNTYTEIPSVEVTGYFGNQTDSAVRAFQRLFGIEPTGVVGFVTWSEITDIYESLYSGSELNDGQYPGYDIGG